MAGCGGAMRAFSVYPHGLWGDVAGNLFVAELPPSGVAKYRAIARGPVSVLLLSRSSSGRGR